MTRKVTITIERTRRSIFRHVRRTETAVEPLDRAPQAEQPVESEPASNQTEVPTEKEKT